MPNSSEQIYEFKRASGKTESKSETKHESHEIKAPTKEELEANIKMREKQQEVKNVEKIYHELHKKSAEEHEKKKE